MHTALTLIVGLLPSLAGTAPASDTSRLAATVAEQSAPLISGPGIDWVALRGDSPARPDTARLRQRTRAIEYSGFYRARLKLHRTLSYTMIPLFIGSYATGEAILKNRRDPPKWAKDLHTPFAIATGSVFAVNTVTGLWNLYDSRHNDVGKVKRTLHSLLFLAASAGFTYAGTSLAHDAKDREDRNHFHKTVAMASIGVSILSWGMMAFFK